MYGTAEWEHRGVGDKAGKSCWDVVGLTLIFGTSVN